jgi:hypothetical protein
MKGHMASSAPTSAAVIFWGVDLALAVLLLIRIYFLRLQGVYRVFVIYLIAEIVGPLAYAVLQKAVDFDYRIWFLLSRPLYWFLYIAMVYALSQTVMRSVPGVYRLSRKVLQWSFIAAAVAGMAVFVLGGTTYTSGGSLHFLVILARSLERSFTLTALLLLAGVLGFLLWFPVQVPKNLAVFSGAYLVFFAVTVATLFAGDFFPKGDSAKFISRAIEIISAVCYIWWLVTLDKAGEQQPVRIGHIWKPAEQANLMTQLNAINDALLSGSRR